MTSFLYFIEVKYLLATPGPLLRRIKLLTVKIIKSYVMAVPIPKTTLSFKTELRFPNTGQQKNRDWSNHHPFKVEVGDLRSAEKIKINEFLDRLWGLIIRKKGENHRRKETTFGFFFPGSISASRI